MNPHDLVQTACREAFVELQKVRQQADYALEHKFSKPDALATINTAEDAIVEFEQADARYRRSFAVHVLFKRRQPREVSR